MLVVDLHQQQYQFHLEFFAVSPVCDKSFEIKMSRLLIMQKTEEMQSQCMLKLIVHLKIDLNTCK